MYGHPIRCAADAACLVGVLSTTLGWLPVLLASIASLLAIIHYSIWLRDYCRRRHDQLRIDE